MVDIALEFDNRRFDVALDGSALKPDAGLRTALFLSLFIDRRAASDDLIPDGTDDRRGWWADASDEPVGSRLWLLSREKTSDDVLQRANDYALEALQWVVDDDIASGIDVATEWVRPAVLGIFIEITKQDGSRFEDVINYSLEAA